MPNLTKFESLRDAGLITEEATQDLRDKVNQLSDEEVSALIAARQKIGFTGHLNNGTADCGF